MLSEHCICSEVLLKSDNSPLVFMVLFQNKFSFQRNSGERLVYAFINLSTLSGG